MKTIAFNLQKGGTGKTTLAVQAAENLSQFGKTCLIDFDPQGNATSQFTVNEFDHELADFFIDGSLSIHDILLKNPDFDFDIIPTAKNGNLADIKGKVTSEIITGLLQELKAVGYKYCILDTPPEMGAYIGAILANTNEVITPILPANFSINGIKIFIETASKARGKNPGLKFDKIILNNYNRSKAKDVYFLENLPLFFSTFKIYNIPTSTKWDLAQTAHKPLYRPQEQTPRGMEQTAAELERLTSDIK